MAQQDATRFLKDMENKPEVRDDFMTLFNYETGKWNAEGVVSKASGKGYNFSVVELTSASEEMYGSELTDEQLEMISGGGCCCSCCIATCCCCTSA